MRSGCFSLRAIARPGIPRVIAYLMTLLHVGGMLNVPIPRRLVRELGLVKRARVYVARAQGSSLLVTPLEDYLRDRRAVRERPAR
jgi:antitoxin component of MazEF toxin-antitoxin module